MYYDDIKDTLFPINVKKYIFPENKYYFTTSGKIYSRYSNDKMTELYLDNSFRGGYKKVKLYDILSIPKMMWVHRLVLESWLRYILPIEISETLDFDDLTIDHIDYDPTNNNINNLRWVSKVDNNRRKSWDIENWTREEKDFYLKEYFINNVSIRNISKSSSKRGESTISTLIKSKYAWKWCKKNKVNFFIRNNANIEVDEKLSVLEDYKKAALNQILKDLSKKDIAEIRKLYNEGTPIKSISKSFKYPLSKIRLLVNNGYIS